MAANSEKEHLFIVILKGRLIFKLGGLPERELEKLKQEAEPLGKGSFADAFYMDRLKQERQRGVTKEFCNDKWKYSVIEYSEAPPPPPPPTRSELQDRLNLAAGGAARSRRPWNGVGNPWNGPEWNVDYYFGL